MSTTLPYAPKIARSCLFGLFPERQAAAARRRRTPPRAGSVRTVEQRRSNSLPSNPNPVKRENWLLRIMIEFIVFICRSLTLNSHTEHTVT